MDLPKEFEPIVGLLQKLQTQDLEIRQSGEGWQISGVAESLYHRDLILREVKKFNDRSEVNLNVSLDIMDDTFYTKHTVQQGESLSLIALKYYEDPEMYRQIFQENLRELDSPDLLREGQVLVIPKPTEN